MPEIITKEDGTEIEVFTQEELENQKQEAIDKYKEENSTDDIDELKGQLEEKEKELKKFAEKDMNFKKARDQKKNAENEYEKLKSEFDTKINEVKSYITGEKKSEMIKALVGDDEETRKKVEYHLGRLTGDDLQQNINDAYFLATKQEALNINFSNSGAGNSIPKDKVSEEQKELARKMGITESDFKKYNK